MDEDKVDNLFVKGLSDLQTGFDFETLGRLLFFISKRPSSLKIKPLENHIRISGLLHEALLTNGWIDSMNENTLIHIQSMEIIYTYSRHRRDMLDNLEFN